MYRYIAIIYVLVIAALIAAKLVGHLHWAWWIIFLPVSVPVTVFIIAALLIIVGFAGAESRGENPFE